MSVTVWRIVKAKHQDDAFSGEGARRFGGRWNNPGLRVVYTAESRSLAAMEMLVHLDSQALLAAYVLASVVIDEKYIQRIDVRNLPLDWRSSPAPVELPAIGSNWRDSQVSAVLRVPSVVIDGEFNFLLNPEHRDFKRLRIQPFAPFQFDARLK